MYKSTLFFDRNMCFSSLKNQVTLVNDSIIITNGHLNNLYNVKRSFGKPRKYFNYKYIKFK